MSILTNGPVLPTRIRGHTIEYVDKYIYLGQRISFRNQSTSEVDRRIKIAWGRYWSLKHIFKAKLPPKVKKKAMDTTVLPTLLYGCQNWALSKKIINKLQVFQRAMERSMLDIRLRDRVKNEYMRRKTNIIDAAKLACQLKWRWAGHVARAGDERWTERVLHWSYTREARRARGCPRGRWRDDIEEVAGVTCTEYINVQREVTARK